MARIKVAAIETLQPGPPAPFETAGEGVVTRIAIGGANAPLHARYYHVPLGATLGWSASPTGFLGYVWQGAVAIDGARLETGSVVVVEPGAAAEAVAVAEESVLLVFNPTAAHEPSGRAGGHVHILPADRVPRMARMNERVNVGAAIFADSACPTCELWLHESAFHDGDFDVALHSHSEDEIIVVTAGEIVLGARHYGVGTAIAVAKDAIYGFRTGAEGLTFINFRPSHPTYRTADGANYIDEQALYMEPLGRPPYLPEKRLEATA